MPRGKKEPAEQVLPYAASVEVEVGPGKTHLRGRAATVDTSTRCRSLWNNDGSTRFVSAPDSHCRLL